MIELQMVNRIAKRCLVIAPFVIAALWAVGDARWALSGAAGLAMTLLNLFLAAQIIGRVAESNPKLLIPAAMASLMLGLMVLTGIALVLRATDVVDFPVTGFTLIGAHLVLVLWEGAIAYKKIPNPITDNPAPTGAGPARARS